MLKIVLLVTFIFFHAHAILTKSSEATFLEQRLQKDPNSLELYEKLISFYARKYFMTKELHYNEKAYQKAKEALNIAPKDSAFTWELVVYKLGEELVFKTRNEEVLRELEALYKPENPFSEELTPASYLAYHVHNEVNSKKAKELLLRAVKENAKYHLSYYNLAWYYLLNLQENLALKYVQKAKALAPKHAASFSLEAYTLSLQAREEEIQKCKSFDEAFNNKRIKLSKTALLLNPKDTLAIRNLIDVYQDIGRVKQALFFQEQLVQMRPGDTNEQLELAEIYSQNLEFQKANKLFASLEKSPALKRAILSKKVYEQYAKQNWQTAFTLSLELLKNSEDFYTHFYSLVAKSIAQKQHDFALLKQLDTLKATPWQKLLKTYMQGTINTNEFLAKADNACKKTEAYYLVGLKRLTEEKKQFAKEAFQKVLLQKVFTYKEYMFSRYYLEKIQ